MDTIAVSVADAAKVTGLGRTTIYRLLAEDRLEKIKVGRRTLIRTSSIRRLIESGE